MVGARDLPDGPPGLLVLLRRQIVQPERQPLGAAARVDEQDRRAVGADQRQQLRVDGRPDRAAGGLSAGHRIKVRCRLAIGLDHRLDRNPDLEVERLPYAGVDDPAPARRADHEAPHLFQGPLGSRETDSLKVPIGLEQR